MPGVTAVLALMAYKYAARRDRERHQAVLANMHDMGGARLSALRVQTEAAFLDIKSGSTQAEKTLEGVVKMVDELAFEVRQSTWLHDSAVSSLQDLALHLATLGGKLFDRADIAFCLDPMPATAQWVQLSASWREQLLGIFQEAMNNAARHARECSRVILAFELHGRHLTVSLRDNGTGFNEEQLSRINGLQNMRRRASQLKGILTIQSDHGKGTYVALKTRLPLGAVVPVWLRVFILRKSTV
jgi:signal transduction histidine kinase